MGSKHVVVMLVAGGIVYWFSSDVRLGFALLAALLTGTSWHLEQQLESLKIQLERYAPEDEGDDDLDS